MGFLTRSLRRSLVRGPGSGDEATRFARCVISCVPLSRAKRRARGFNQAEVLAQGLAERVGVPFVRALRRTRETSVQGSQASHAARAANVAGAFVHTRSARRIHGRRVLLVDDVMTSGATLRECARALRRAGAREVEAFVCARASAS